MSARVRKLLWWVALALGLLAGGLAAGSASADVFGPISLASLGTVEGSEVEQAQYAHDPAISADGRYLAFDGSIGGVTGVWRRDLQTGRIEQVAGGDAELPSISADGRYVSFTTNEGASLPAITDGLRQERPQLEPVAVYVRDMEVPAARECSPGAPAPLEECAFTAASAPSGSTAPLTYAVAPGSSEYTTLGAAAVGRSAISADGREVAFVTTAVSDLLDPQTPAEPSTPAFQVAVRYLAEARTKLVSGRYEPASGRTSDAPVPETDTVGSDAAVYPDNKVAFAPAPAYGAYGSGAPPGASISADGTTVAWMGAHIAEQAPLLPGEVLKPDYTEPLWRRIAPGSESPTERVTGGSDPLNPACAASGETALPAQPAAGDPCQGPFVVAEGQPAAGILAGGSTRTVSFVPRLSSDGYTVAFVSQAPLVALGSNFGGGKSGQADDVYVADMHPGLTRDQALTPLTELAGSEAAGVADTAPVVDFDISPDGSQVAFTTKRTQFPLGLPAYVSPPAAEPGMNELFDADLRDGTLTRVTTGYSGGPGEHPHIPRPSGQDPYEETGDGGLSPSFSSSGDLLAFSSTASNLVWDDGNTPPLEQGRVGSFDGADAFLVERRSFEAQPTPSYISPAPAGPALTPPRGLSVTAVSRADGSVVLFVEVPGRGALRATAAAAVPLQALAARRSRLGRRARSQAGRQGLARRAALRRGALLEAVATRTVAATLAASRSTAVLRLTLRLGRPYAALASQRGGLSATAKLVFVAAAGKPVLRASIPVTFLRGARSARSRSHDARRGRGRGR
jgi:hypothetical protein